mmetsp:Transcript_475/g.1345  ORF Transcript_475/g.1345 Transcript_475/m.1345 type:complete len:147 (-) Transcript_475:1242-1682(-)
MSGSRVPYTAFGQGQDDSYNSSGMHSGSDKLRQAQNDVDEVVVVMRNNMEKVLERDTALGDLQDKSESLMSGSSRFKTTSRTLKNTMWWQNVRWWVWLLLILGIIVVIIIIVEVPKHQGGGGGGGGGSGGTSPTTAPPPPPTTRLG